MNRVPDRDDCQEADCSMEVSCTPKARVDIILGPVLDAGADGLVSEITSSRPSLHVYIGSRMGSKVSNLFPVIRASRPNDPSPSAT